MSKIDWCGYEWTDKMGGWRTVHPSFPWYWYSIDVITEIPDGSLSLTIRENPKEVHQRDAETHEVKTYYPTMEVATMRSEQDFSYGRFSCEMLMPEGKNLSASFWLTGSGNWPPEIDIEEGWTEEKKSWFRLFEKYAPFIKPSWRTTTNVHYRTDNLVKTHIGSRNICWCKQHKNPSKNFVTYACEWRPDEIVFYTNGRVVRRVGEDVAHKLVNNVTDPEKGTRCNVIFNVWCENPEVCDVQIYQPMQIRNFVYEPFEKC